MYGFNLELAHVIAWGVAEEVYYSLKKQLLQVRLPGVNTKLIQKITFDHGHI
jgi:hypothetical protein